MLSVLVYTLQLGEVILTIWGIGVYDYNLEPEQIYSLQERVQFL